MKIVRHRKMKKIMNFYKNHFDLRVPYQVFIDGNFCNEALECKLNINEQLPHYLEDENIRLFTTACVIEELQMLANHAGRLNGALHILKQFKVRKCGHERDCIPAPDCITSMIANGNPHHFIVATNDKTLSDYCRLNPGIPLLYVKHNAVILEKPTKVSREVANGKMKAATELTEFEKQQLERSKTLATVKSEEPKQQRKKRKGPKEPNSLSCLKKKKKKEPVVATPVEKESSKTRKNKSRRENRKKKKALQKENWSKVCRDMFGGPSTN